MSSFDSEEFSFLDFIKLEIKNTLIGLRDETFHLQDPSSILSGAQNGGKYAKELVKLFVMRPWNLIFSLVENIEHYFQAIQDGIPLIPSQLEILEKALKELLDLVECETIYLEKKIESQKDAIEHLAHQLAQFSGGIQNQRKSKLEEAEEKSELESVKLPIEASNNQHVALDPAMFDLFCSEIVNQMKILNDGLLELEKRAQDPELLQILMRASHSIKGAARVVHLDPIVHLAHAMEKLFVAAQQDKIEISSNKIDQLLQIVDFLNPLVKIGIHDIFLWLEERQAVIDSLIQAITSIEAKTFCERDNKTLSLIELKNHPSKERPGFKEKNPNDDTKVGSANYSEHNRILHITAENFTRLMSLAGESLVESRSLNSLIENLKDIKTRGEKIEKLFELLKSDLKQQQLGKLTNQCLEDLNQQITVFRLHTGQHVLELDDFIWRHAHLSDQLYDEALKSRMRPFIEGIEIFPRMIRDLARSLNKQIRFEIEGKLTFVDREILEKLELPLSHLLRHAAHYGIESPTERVAASKSAEGVIKLDARHRGGVLVITVSDDGRGIDIEKIRKEICEKKLASEEMALHLTESEVIDFLFLSKFSCVDKQIELGEGRIDLQSVQNFIQEVGGSIRAESIIGIGTTFHLQLPITLSVIRALIVEIAGEAFAFPLARIDQVFLLPVENIKIIENRQFFELEEELIPLVAAWEVLDLHQPHLVRTSYKFSKNSNDLIGDIHQKCARDDYQIDKGGSIYDDDRLASRSNFSKICEKSELELNLLSVIVLKEHVQSYGLIVDCFVGEKELVLQDLEARLGKIQDISAGALMEDGSPVLIIDVEDILRSIDYLHSGGRLSKIANSEERVHPSIKKRILVVDDSMTVREVESRLLSHQGYEVETAVNGVDGWNAVRLNHYDLIITDIDMPRMNGFELVQAIRRNAKFQSLPIVIVSYKDEEENRMRGLEVGATQYLTKNSLNDEKLIYVVKELIGEP